MGLRLIVAGGAGISPASGPARATTHAHPSAALCAEAELLAWALQRITTAVAGATPDEPADHGRRRQA